jgi:hypothetical protein
MQGYKYNFTWQVTQRDGGKGVMFETRTALVRPRYLKQFLRAHPEFKDAACHLVPKPFNVVIVQCNPISDGLIPSAQALADHEEWMALLGKEPSDVG